MEGRILEGSKLIVTRDPARIHQALEQSEPIWVELEKQDHECDRLLSERLHLHALTIEDIWSESAQPKLEDYEHYLYLMLHSIVSDGSGKVKLVELDLVLGASYVITYDPHGLVAEVRSTLDRSPKLLERGPAWLMHALVDTAVDRYLPVIDRIDHDLEELENEVMRKAGTPQGPPLMRKILGFKRLLVSLRRMSVHQREILLRLARAEFDEIPADAVPFYRDICDHFLRVTDQIESYRDITSSALEAYLSVQSNRMNEIMKALTVISTVMLPITFIAGVYGMNFELMPELHSPWGYPLTLLTMFVISTTTVVWFWRKGWIGAKAFDVEVEDTDDAPKL